MAKEFENDFYNQLQNSVIKDEPVTSGQMPDKLSDLMAKREQLLRTLEEMQANVIVDPKAVDKIKKEIKDLEKAIEAGKIASSTEATLETDEDEKKKKEQKDEEELGKKVEDEDLATKEEEQRKAEEQAKSEALKEQYYNALVGLYEQKIANMETIKREGKLVTSRDTFEREMVMEEEMYRLRDEYMAMGFEDPFKAKRTELIAKLRDSKEPVEVTLREKARKFREYQEEFSRMDQEEKEIHEELMDPDISSARREELNESLEQLGAKRKNVELQLTDIRRDLEPAVEERADRAFLRAGLERQHIETLTESDKANYMYQKAKVDTMNYNTEKAVAQEYRNLKLRIEDREQHIKDLKNELQKTPATDFERRLELLGKLDKEAAMLEADRESKSDMDIGIRPTDDQRKMEVVERFENEEARREEFESETKTVRAVIEAQDEKIGARVVEEPLKETIEDKDRESDTKAATAAILVDDPTKPGPDSTLDNVKQYAVAKCVIEGLEDKVRDPELPEDALAMVENDEAIRKANEELERQQEELENQIV